MPRLSALFFGLLCAACSCDDGGDPPVCGTLGASCCEGVGACNAGLVCAGATADDLGVCERPSLTDAGGSTDAGGVDASRPDAGADAGVDAGSSDAGPASLLYGPTPYLDRPDGPFAALTFDDYFHLEDFEDGVANTPGVTYAGSLVVLSSTYGAGLIDSVDGDDGDPADGQCAPMVGSCEGYHEYNGASGFTITFDATALGGLPTHAGVVWTDGAGVVRFEAFDATGASLGTLDSSGDPAFPDGSYSGTTAEDRFFGAYDRGGISRLVIGNSEGGIEIDHVQYGR